MAETAGITTRVLDALAVAGVITTEQLATVEGEAASNGENAGRMAVEHGLAAEGDIASVLEDALGVPRVDLESYAPDEAALEIVPAELARELSIVPLFEIEGVLTVAIGDASGVFDLDALGDRLGLEVEAVLAEPLAVREALAQHYPAPPDEAPRVVEAPPAVSTVAALESLETNEETPRDELSDMDATEWLAAVSAANMLDEPSAPVAEPVAAPDDIARADARADADASAHWIDLDVLAVADPSRMALLVTEILEEAVSLHATKIHILPYKDDFFVVFRIAGRLKQVGAAPLSLQSALVEGVRSFMRLPAPALGQPSVGRLHTEIAGVGITLTLSAVKTISGHRLVVSLDDADPTPRPTAELGMSEQDRRAFEAVLERGTGLLLLCSPIGEGASETYYSALSHVAACGKTSYSIERSISYEIPAAAQVSVPPGSPVGSAAYFSAGLRQDTDVMAIDPLETAEDVRLAIQAATEGKLVIATFAASSVASALRRLLELGVDPTSLSSSLTMVIAQRLVRGVCQACAVEDEGELQALIPGAEPGTHGKAGVGCPACHDSGFDAVRALFEVAAATAHLVAAVQHDATVAELERAAQASGTRSFAEIGLELWRAGSVSAAELERVLRFSE